jgi:hypothetical protein
MSQREFYGIAAFFNNTPQDPLDGNVKDTPPVITVPMVADRQRWEELAKQIRKAKKLLDERRTNARSAFDTWLASAKPTDVAREVPSDFELLVPLDEDTSAVHYVIRGQPAKVPLPTTLEWRNGKLAGKAAYLNQGAVIEVPEAGDFDSSVAFSYSAWVKLPNNDGSGAILARMNEGMNFRGWDLWVEGRRIGGHLINSWPANAIKVMSRDQLPADTWMHVTIAYDGKSKAAGFQVYVDGQLQPTNVLSDSLNGTTTTSVPFKIGQRHNSSPLPGVTVQDVRLYERRLVDSEIASLAMLPLSTVVATAPEKRTTAGLDTLYVWWLTSIDEAYKTLSQTHASLVREESDIKSRATTAHVMQERAAAAVAHVLHRGEYDQRRDQVTPDTPDMLPPFPAEAPRNRLGFAKWLLIPDHPLTARVTVNRFWSEVVGTGLVKTADDFGVTGELPSHPELLDWLAVEFRESNWDVKKLFKLIVTSATYRQSAAVTAEKLEKDADNRLLSRGPRFRMDAEMVRDNALAASGLLVEKIGGPSVKPYQPPGVWEAVAMASSNTRDYKQDAGESLYRRSIYTFWKRSAPPASMELFNAPNRESCTVVRERTNTPLQALVTMNDTQFVEAARHLAMHALESNDNVDRRIDFLAGRLLARQLCAEELVIVRGAVQKFERHYMAHHEDATKLVAVGQSRETSKAPTAQLAAWTMVTNELMNLDEVINK